MNEVEKQILEEYARSYNVEAISYETMGKMLDERYVEERLKLFDVKNMYLYGGTYMAVQFYRVGKKYTTIKGIVDRSGKIILNDNIPILTLNEFQTKYNSEKVIVTPIRYLQQIKKDLEAFMDAENIISIGELMFGIV